MLTRADFEDFFPKQIGDYSLIQVGEDGTRGVGSGAYIKGKDYGTIIHYYVTDGHRKGAAAIRNFEDNYRSGSKKSLSHSSVFINKQRDGFKTVALLREQYKNYKISTLYNGRFVLTVEGKQKPDELWTYLKQADLQILDSL